MDLDIKPLGVNLSCAEDGPQDEWVPPCDQTTRMTSSMVEVVRIAYMIVITAVLSASTTENWGEVLYLSSEIFYFHSEDF